MYTDVAFIRCRGKNVMVVVENPRKSIYIWMACMRPDELFIILPSFIAQFLIAKSMRNNRVFLSPLYSNVCGRLKKL